MQNPGYVLGHSDQEVVRLRAQARLLESVTRGFLLEAGITPGMRILDVGSGAGDVAFLAAELVGSSGSVVGTDRESAAVAAASAGARKRNLGNVSFREGDPVAMSFEQPFDAVVGRFVLLFQADASAMLGGLVRHVRRGGVVLFHEPDWTSARSMPAAPTYDRCCRWLQEVFRLSGTDTNMAEKLYHIFVRAGLRAPSMKMQSFIGGGAASDVFIDALADLTSTLVPAMEALGVATRAEIDAQTLAARMKREVSATDSVIIGRSEIGIWARI
jgi:ubiquinone/menaquinone biosynthesis C-methylase UbiE